MFKVILIITFCVCALLCNAQSPKKHYRTAQDLVDGKQFSAAISELNKAILGDPNLTDAIVLRAEVYELLENYASAANDYSLASKQRPNEGPLCFNAGVNYYRSKQYQLAIIRLSEAIMLDSNNIDAHKFEALTLNKLYEYDNAIEMANIVLAKTPDYLTYYARGVANDSLQNFNQAISDYKASITIDPTFCDAYLACIKAYQRNNQLQQALALANQTTKKFESVAETYQIRSLIYKQLNDLPNAINDLSKLETILTDISDVLFTRGQYYFEFGQYQNAKSDFSRLLNLKQIAVVYYWRGRASEELLETEMAISDYKNFKTLAGTYNLPLLADADKRLFILMGEKDKPVVLIDSPMVTPEFKMMVLNQTELIQIRGRVFDASGVTELLVNQQPVTVTQDGFFMFEANPGQISGISFRAKDVYENVLEVSYEFQWVTGE